MFQVFCFVSAYSGEMIPAEAVTKLRQKHPGTIRVAEENRGTLVQVSGEDVYPYIIHRQFLLAFF
jgi:hypothetical protein